MARAKVAKTAVPAVEYEKQPWNIYSTMLLLALLAIVIGCVFLCLELSAYNWDYNAKTAPKAAMVAPPAGPVSAATLSGRLLG